AEQLGEHSHLAGPGLEATHVDEAGGEHLSCADRGDPPDGHEHVAAAGDLDDKTDHAGGDGTSIHDDDIPDLAEPVAHGVEDGAACQARDENPLCAHSSS